MNLEDVYERVFSGNYGEHACECCTWFSLFVAMVFVDVYGIICLVNKEVEWGETDVFMVVSIITFAICMIPSALLACVCLSYCDNNTNDS